MLFLYINLKIFQRPLKLILRRKAGVEDTAALAVSPEETAVIKHFVALINDEEDDIILSLSRYRKNISVKPQINSKYIFPVRE